MDISVIICTRNRAERLPHLFEALFELDTEGIEVEFLFINNNSIDNTGSIIKQHLSMGILKNFIFIDFRGSLSAAKNHATTKSAGRILSFTDDDCYPRSSWLKNIYGFFANNESSMLVGGRVTLHDKNDYPITITEDSIVSPTISYYQSLWASIHGCNISIRRIAFEKVGGFDKYLGPGTLAMASEDRDLFYRIAREFGAINYDPSIIVSHHHGRRTEVEISSLMKSYSIGEDAFFYKHFLRLNFKGLKMIAMVMSWRYDKVGSPRTIVLIKSISAMITGYFRGKRHYRGQQVRKYKT